MWKVISKFSILWSSGNSCYWFRWNKIASLKFAASKALKISQRSDCGKVEKAAFPRPWACPTWEPEERALSKKVSCLPLGPGFARRGSLRGLCYIFMTTEREREMERRGKSFVACRGPPLQWSSASERGMARGMASMQFTALPELTHWAVRLGIKTLNSQVLPSVANTQEVCLIWN